MFAALKGMTVDAFIYGGSDFDYPDWFALYVASDCEEDGFDNLVWDDINEYGVITNCTTIVPYESAFLYKEVDGKVYIHSFTLEEFDRMFYFIGDYLAALKEDCSEFVVFSDFVHGCDTPLWFKALLTDGSLELLDWCENGIFHSDRGVDTYVSDFGIFAKNHLGEVRYFEFEEFSKHYMFN